MRFISETEGPYLIHCKEGKDRTGFVIAVIECLAGASWQEIKEDYLKTYINFFKIETSDPLYERIAEIKKRRTGWSVRP
jgi:protein tyrosine/serine phosphatase